MSFDFPEQEFDNGTEIVEASLADESIPAKAISSPEEDKTGSGTLDPLAHIATDQLSFLHPTSLLFDLIAHGKTYLVPAAFGLWGAAQGDLTLLIISGLIFVPAFLASIFRYFTFRYCINEGNLIVRQGLIFRNVRTVPITKIQNIDFIQNPLHRLLKVAEVKVETASGTKPEATLRVLSMAQMENLRDVVFDTPAKKVAAFSESPSPNPDDFVGAWDGAAPQAIAISADKTEPLLEIPLSRLIKSGLASNRGMIMVGVLMGVYFQFGERRNFFRFQWLRSLWPEEASLWFIILSSIIGLIVAFLLLRLLGVGWFILRFYGYKLVRRGDDLRISCGLFTKVSATVPRQRVQFISIHRTLIMRWMGLAAIRIETAGGAGKDSENATEAVSKRWFIPVLPEDRVSELIQVLRPGIQWDETSLNFQPLAAKAGRRLSRMAIVQSIIVAAIGIGITRPWGWTAGLALLPLLLLWALKKSRAMRYARTDDGVIYRSGVFNRKTSMTFFEKIQTLRVDQSPFDRRWGMAKLLIDTAAAGPADHRIEVPYLDENFAQDELQLLRVKTGNEQPVFG